MSVKIPGEGDVPISGKGSRGDLFIRVNVAASKTFRRRGPSLYYDARIPVHTAILGGRARVPTLDGEIDVKVPTGVQQGEELVVKGYGLPVIPGGLRGGKGDLHVHFNVQIPR